MKRRLLLGFAVAFLILAVAVGTAFYVTIYRPTQAVMADLEQLAELRAMNGDIVNAGGFMPPADGLLSEEQVERFGRVQASMSSDLGDDYGVLRERAMAMEGLVKDGDAGGGGMRSRPVRVKEAILAFQGLGPVLRRAKEAQIRALNREGFSLKEYRWVRESVFRALGFSRVDRYFEDYAAADATEEASEASRPDGSTAGPSENRDLVAPVSSRAEDWFPFLVFGL